MNVPIFNALCVGHGLPIPVAEFKFHPTRKWRFDFAWIAGEEEISKTKLVALEIDGSVWRQGRHTRGQGFIDDQEKLNNAAVMGWCVIRCTPDDVQTGKVFELLKRALL
jgi:hypothetical protein